MNTIEGIKYVPDEPRDGQVILSSPADLSSPYKIKLHEVKVVAEMDDSITVDFIYTYNDAIPVDEIKLFVMPDHSYWSTNAVKIKRGKHGARAVIGLSDSNMDKDRTDVSKTSKLRFRFDHYKPKKYLGNIWGQDVEFSKMWKRN